MRSLVITSAIFRNYYWNTKNITLAFRRGSYCSARFCRYAAALVFYRTEHILHYWRNFIVSRNSQPAMPLYCRIMPSTIIYRSIFCQVWEKMRSQNALAQTSHTQFRLLSSVFQMNLSQLSYQNENVKSKWLWFGLFSCTFRLKRYYLLQPSPKRW